MNFAAYFILPACLVLATGGLALYRKFLAMQEDDSLHLAAGGERTVSKQAGLAEKLSSIDRWGKTLTILAVFSGVFAVGMFLYRAWLASAGR